VKRYPDPPRDTWRSEDDGIPGEGVRMHGVLVVLAWLALAFLSSMALLGIGHTVAAIMGMLW